MNAKRTQPQQLLDWMNSLSDPTRLRVLRLLDQHELGVAELCDILQMPQSTVSRHLKHLSTAGWVHSRKSGTSAYYRMIVEELPESAQSLWAVAQDQMGGWAAPEQDEVRLARVLAARAGDVEAFFAEAAEQWDWLRQSLYGAAFSEAALLALIPSDWVVLDLGCGTGALAARLAPHVGKVIGVDRSEAMLEAARLRARNLSNLDLRQGDLEALPVEDGAADGALMILVLTYLEQPAKALAEMRRSLAPGGRAVVIDLLHHDQEDFRRRMGQRSTGFSRDDLAEALDAAGFVNVRCEPLPPEAGAQGPALLLATGTAPAEKETA
ncbi:MAG: ArsR/SmtB family transcription factor [Bradymonadia bacterium]